MAILVAKTKDDIYFEEYIDFERNCIIRRDGEVIDFNPEYICKIKDTSQVTGSWKDKIFMPFKVEEFIPGMVYEFYKNKNVIFCLKDVVEFEYVPKNHLFELASCTLYEKMEMIFMSDLSDEDKLRACKGLIYKMNELAKIWEDTAYKAIQRQYDELIKEKKKEMYKAKLEAEEYVDRYNRFCASSKCKKEGKLPKARTQKYYEGILDVN